jgi:outer membrane protein TolC
MSFNNNTTQQNAFLNNYNPTTNSFLDLQVTQPLLQGFGFAINNRNIRVAKNNIRVTDYAFQQQVITTVNSIVQLYWNLVSFNLDVDAKKQSLALAQKLYEDNQKQVEIGVLAPISITQAKAQVAGTQTDLLTSETNVLQQETTLKNVLSRNGIASPSLIEAHIIPTDRITLPDVEPIEPVQDLVAKAFDHRPELAQTRLQLENSKISLTGTKNSLLPTLSLVGDVRNSGLSGTPNTIRNPINGLIPNHTVDPFFVGGYGNVLGQVFGRNFPTYSIGVNLNVPLRNRSAQADYTTAQLQLRQSELNLQKSISQVRVDVQSGLIAVQQARARYQSAVEARILQEQTLDAEQKKYEFGASTVYNVIQIQRDLANARQVEVTALTSYGLAKLQLDLATGNILDAYNIQVEEAKSGRVSRPPDPIVDVAPNGRAGAGAPQPNATVNLR